MKSVGVFVIAAIVAVTLYLAAWPTELEPAAWDAPAAVALEGPLAPNDALAGAEALFTGLDGPDTVAFDSHGRAYTGTYDGRILRSQEGRAGMEPFAQIEGRPTGMAFDAAGNLVVADERSGTLWSVSPSGTASALAREVDGERLSFLNDVAVAADGTIYFTQSSTKFSLEQFRLEVLEHGRNGRLLAYDPASASVRVVAGGLEFPNGLAVSPDQAYIVVAETTAYRISRHWLMGPKAGRTEPLVTGLPGFVGDLSSSPQGYYWATLLSPRNELLDHLAARPGLREVLARLPRSLMPDGVAYPFVVAVDGRGRVLRSLQAAPSRALPSFSSAVERDDGTLYLGTAGIDSAIDGDTIFALKLP